MMNYRYGRKRSGIRYEIVTKIEGWLKSIKDEKVKKLAAENVIVTGGSIASMLLGEKVNDFDLYFRNIETTTAVARYYVDQFNKDNKIDSVNGYYPAVRLMPTRYYEHIEDKDAWEEMEKDRVKIHMQSAGVAAEEQGLYTYSEFHPDQTQEFMGTLFKEKKKSKKKYRPIFLTDNAITLSEDIQIIVRFYGEPEQIHENYDFVHCKCSWDHKNGVLDLPADALEALLARNLVYTGSLYPVCSIFRMKKFLTRGWRINAGNQLKIMMQVAELNLRNIWVLQDQLLGVDVAYMHELLLALSKLKDLHEIDGTYLASLIDEIFEGGEPIKGEGFVEGEELDFDTEGFGFDTDE